MSNFQNWNYEYKYQLTSLVNIQEQEKIEAIFNGKYVNSEVKNDSSQFNLPMQVFQELLSLMGIMQECRFNFFISLVRWTKLSGFQLDCLISMIRIDAVCHNARWVQLFIETVSSAAGTYSFPCSKSIWPNK